MSKLLSCPFCGNASPRLGGNDREGDMIICRAMDCGAVMYADDEETVITRWNTRAPAQAAPTCGLRDRLERVLSEWWFWEISEISAKGRAEILDGLMAATLSSTELAFPCRYPDCGCVERGMNCVVDAPVSSTDKPGEA